MSRIAGSSYDENDRRNELGFNSYENEEENEIIEDLAQRSFDGSLDAKSNKILNTKIGHEYLLTILDIINHNDSNEAHSKLLDNMMSCLIYHKDPKKYSKRETACAYLDTICDWSDIYREEKSESDNKPYKVKDLYSGYIEFLKDNKDIFKTAYKDSHCRLTRKNFKKMLSQGTIVKDRVKINGKMIWAETAIGLPQKIDWNK